MPSLMTLMYFNYVILRPSVFFLKKISLKIIFSLYEKGKNLTEKCLVQISWPNLKHVLDYKFCLECAYFPRVLQALWTTWPAPVCAACVSRDLTSSSSRQVALWKAHLDIPEAAKSHKCWLLWKVQSWLLACKTFFHRETLSKRKGSIWNLILRGK